MRLFPLWNILLVTSIAAAGLAALPEARAAGGSSDSGSNSAATIAPGYAEAKTAVDAGQYPAALKILATVVKAEPRNADAWNLMGYSSRKMKRFDEADRYYGIALKIDPRHLGALEYQGELFVETGEYDRAKNNLKLLRNICGNCEEQADLQAVLAAAGQS